MKSKIAGLVSALVAGVFATQAHAGPIFGGSTLLTAPFVTQLEIWLGQGPKAFNNVFTKTLGSDAIDFHTAADGLGPTFSVFEAFVDGDRYVIGGYNPQSWHSSGSATLTPNDADRTAFIFNLTTTKIHRQDLGLNTSTGSDTGDQQTFNWIGYGPVWGVFDLFVDGNLNDGYADTWGYCPVGETGCAHNFNIIDASGAAVNFDSIGALEVFTITNYIEAPVGAPAPGALALLGLGLLGIGASRRRKAA